MCWHWSHAAFGIIAFWLFRHIQAQARTHSHTLSSPFHAIGLQFLSVWRAFDRKEFSPLKNSCDAHSIPFTIFLCWHSFSLTFCLLYLIPLDDCSRKLSPTERFVSLCRRQFIFNIEYAQVLLLVIFFSSILCALLISRTNVRTLVNLLRWKVFVLFHFRWHRYFVPIFVVTWTIFS